MPLGRGNGICKDPETRGHLDQSLNTSERRVRNELAEEVGSDMVAFVFRNQGSGEGT